MSVDVNLAALSHELRTPLNAIRGLTRLALRADTMAQVKDYLQQIDQASGLMLSVTNDVLDLSRLQAGQLDIDPDQPMAVRALIGEVIGLGEAVRARSTVSVGMSIAADTPDWVRADCNRMKQILLNLLVNALKYTERGFIKLSVKVRAQAHGAVVLRFSVADTGLGMPMTALDRIGGQYHRHHEASHPGIQGTGLGLSVVKQLLELMGSELHCSSVEGGGSTFWFDMEWRTCAAPLPSIQPTKLTWSDGSALAGYRLLLVEDNPLNMRVLADFLRSQGAHISQAEHGTKALALLGASHFDAAIIDLHLPDMTGWAVAEEMKRDPLIAKCPFMFLSAHVDAAHQIQAELLGAFACMAKPVEFDDLIQLIQRQPCVQSGMQQTDVTAAESEPSLQTMFAAQWVEQRKVLRSAGAPIAVRETLHALRGSFAVLRQTKLLSQVKQLEQLGQDGGLVGRAALDALIQDIDDWLFNLPG